MGDLDLFPTWRLKGECVGVDPDIFFKTIGRSGSKKARAFCERCVVQPECREWAIQTVYEPGIHGGMNLAEIRAERTRRKALT